MFRFGNLNISKKEVFYESEHTVGLVNLKPISFGHVLVVPKRMVLRYSDLLEIEVADLTLSARRISTAISQLYPETKEGLIWLFQDGIDAGQTVPHVHLHLIPKRFKDWCKDSEDRESRSIMEMENEANLLRDLLNKVQ